MHGIFVLSPLSSNSFIGVHRIIMKSPWNSRKGMRLCTIFFSSFSYPLVIISYQFLIHLPLWLLCIIFLLYFPSFQCYDEASCQARWEYKKTSMTSTLFPAYKVKKGFMDSSMKKTPFWGANKAMLGYCSSDGYVGVLYSFILCCLLSTLIHILLS